MSLIFSESEMKEFRHKNKVGNTVRAGILLVLHHRQLVWNLTGLNC